MKAKNETFQRFLLAIRKQGKNKTVDQYKQALEIQAKNCTFSALSVGKHQEECLRDAFVRGIRNDDMRQKLLENDVNDWNAMITSARSYESSHASSK